MRRFLLLTIFALLALAGAVGAAAWWLHQPLDLPQDVVDLSIEPGTSPRGVARDVAEAGVRVDPRLLYAWFRVSGKDRQIRAGSYEITQGTTLTGRLRNATDRIYAAEARSQVYLGAPRTFDITLYTAF